MAAVRRVAWRHPEWGAVLVAALAWSLLVVVGAGPPNVQQAHVAFHHRAPVPAGAIAWTLMALAMMVPTTLPVARDHALGALWARQRRTVGLFVTAYVAVWGGFGALAAGLIAIAERSLGGDHGPLLACALGVAAAWALTPAKWRAVRACHLVSPLPPAGRRADTACVRAGLVYGRRCVVACWPVMLAMAVAGHQALALMVVLAFIVAAEQWLVRPTRFAVPIAAVLAGDAVLALAL